LVNEEKKILKFAVLTDTKDQKQLKAVELKIGEGIAGTVWQKGTPLIINDVSKDDRFSNLADKMTSNRTTSLIAVPLTVNGKIIGVMEAINKVYDGVFNKIDLEIFLYLAGQAAIAIENARLYELAVTDGLTGLFIHRFFYNRLEEEIKRALRYKNDLALVMLDIDFFKKLNDTYGHQAGDEVLLKTADCIRENCRLSDIPCRYGGEEFCIILPDTDIKGALIFAEKLRNKIADLKINYLDNILKYTVSLGVVSFCNNNPSDKQEFVAMADKALYQSKNTGRNRTTLYKDTTK
jgi:diguanylate cyclase (GGDEF)-like protein